MFLPKDLTAAEAELADTITRNLLAHRAPSTSSQEQAVRHEAAQVAAEMIWEARAATQSHSRSQEDEELERDLADSPYHQRLARLQETARAIQEAEDTEADEGT
jgi:hypothetical protein